MKGLLARAREIRGKLGLDRASAFEVSAEEGKQIQEEIAVMESVFSSVGGLKAERGFLMLLDPDTGKLDLRAARNLGADEWTVFRRVMLPAALPHVLTGMRVGLGVAFIVVIVAEMIDGDELRRFVAEHQRPAAAQSA